MDDTTAATPEPAPPREIAGAITVGSRIIDYLSSGLYQSPAACLKELVNNSYDADATIVNILIKPDADFIAIEDDGDGMSASEFQRHFSRIAESYKREGGETTPRGRPKIGKIGIGFIAANELCDEMEIYSTKQNSRELLHVTIDFSAMRSGSQDDRRTGDDEFIKGDYYGLVSNDANPDEHYTYVYLKKVSENARKVMAGAVAPLPDMRAQSLYGLRADTVASRLADLNTWSSLDEYSQTRLGVALNVPVPYAQGWAEGIESTVLRNLERGVRQLNFAVNYDGSVLEKPIVLRTEPAGSIVRELTYEGQHVSAHGYLYARHGILRPTELNGVLLRIRNAAVGEYRRDFLEFPSSTGQLFQRWITSEIYADDRLEEALNIDRSTLRETHEAYVELKEWFHKQLSQFVAQVRSELYSAPARQRQANKAASDVAALREVAQVAKETISPAAGMAIENALEARSTDARKKPHASRTFTAAQLYTLVVEVARDVLPSDLATRFIQELTKRMQGRP